MSNKKANKGFTLIELLVVIFIIGILSALLIINFTKIRMKARDNRRKADIADIANAVELYYSQYHKLPGLSNNTSYDIYQLSNDLSNAFRQYLPKPPADPLISGSGSTGYIYYQNDTGHYCIFTRLENPGTSDNSNIGNSLCQISAFPNNCHGGVCNFYIDK